MNRWMHWLLVPLWACAGDEVGDDCDEDEDCEEVGEGLICEKATDATEKEAGICTAVTDGPE